MRILTARPGMTLALAIVAEVVFVSIWDFPSALLLSVVMWIAVFFGMWAEDDGHSK